MKSLRRWFLRRILVLFVLTAVIELAALRLAAYRYGPTAMSVIALTGLGIACLVAAAATARLSGYLEKLLEALDGFLGGETSGESRGISLSETGDFSDKLESVGRKLRERGEEFSELRKQVSESERLTTLGRLAAGVAHELNNPLGGILVYSHLLREDTGPDDPRYSNIEKIIKESNRCRLIVKSLLDFARQSQPVLDRVDVNSIVVEALDNIRSERVFGNIAVARNLDENLPPVMADGSQIQEVFENIIRNAAEVLGGSGELTITSRPVRDEEGNPMVEVLFEDTGPGIPDDKLDRIFDPFYTTKAKGHGTGLGLAVSSGIMERHRGSITVRNRPHGGAAFSVRLPAGRAADE